VRAASVDELVVYQKALAAAHEVSALLKRPCFQRDPRLRDQLGASSDGCASLISDGFAQSTDRFFAQFCYRSKGESKETQTHLKIAKGRDYISESELKILCSRYDEIEKMLTGLIHYLERSDWKHRG
jgi:four helix bundle protein